MTHSVEVVKATDSNNAILRANGVDPGKVKFTNISLWMPRLTLNPKYQARMLKFMNDKKSVETPFQQLKYFDNAFDDINDITWDITNFSKPTGQDAC